MKSMVTSSGNPKYTAMRGMIPSKRFPSFAVSACLAFFFSTHPKSSSKGPSRCSPPSFDSSVNRDARVNYTERMCLSLGGEGHVAPRRHRRLQSFYKADHELNSTGFAAVPAICRDLYARRPASGPPELFLICKRGLKWVSQATAALTGRSSAVMIRSGICFNGNSAGSACLAYPVSRK
jgi:hypothetical protein